VHVRPSRSIIVIVGVALAFLCGGIAAGRFVKSPEEQLSETRPPPYTQLTEKVRLRSLQANLQGDGPVRFSRVTTVQIPPPASGDLPVITSSNVRAGDTITPGQVVCSVAGRPVMVLTGRFSMYRDIHPGNTGPDIHQLQRALGGLGYAEYDADGTFGASTQAAVRAFYADRGFEAPQVTIRSTPTSGSKSSPVTGVVVPRSEVVFVPPERLEVLSSSIHVGATLSGPAYRLSSGKAYVTINLPTTEAEQVTEGMPATILASDDGAAPATVAKIGKPHSTEANGLTVPITIRYKDAPPVGVAGSQVRVSIVLGRGSQRRLVVPQAAIFTSADASLSVLRVQPSGSTRVEVALGRTGDGYVEVKPRSGTLHAGDRVVVSEAP